MDQNQDNFHEESLVNLLSLPTELLVYIVSFLSSLRDRVKLRYVSRWLRCVIEETPSLWKEFVWPYYDSRDECSVKEVLKVCGEHVKVLSFPSSRVPSLVEMLQYCSNVQHLSLPSTKLVPEQLRKAIHHMGCLQTLELKADNECQIKQLLFETGQLREITLFLPSYRYYLLKQLFKYWIKIELKPLILHVYITLVERSRECLNLIGCVTRLTKIPTSTTAIFRLYDDKVPLNFSPALPYFQLQFEKFGKVTTPSIKLSEFGILRLHNDVAVMTDCQYGGRMMYMLRCQTDDRIVNKLNSIPFANSGILGCATHFDLTGCISLYSGHLEQLAIVCPNLRRLNLQKCFCCLINLAGLQAIASHCHNLQGLNLLGICFTLVQDHILLWEILHDMKLTHLAMEFCVLRSEAANEEKLICLQKCCTIRGIQCDDYCCETLTKEDILMLSYFPSLNYCYVKFYGRLPTIVQDIINNCKELRYVSFNCYHISKPLSLSSNHNHNLQQLCIDSTNTDVPDNFMTSVSAHGGLVHVVMFVKSLTVEGITSLLRNSPKLITLYLYVSAMNVNVLNFKATLKKMFWNRIFFTAGLYKLTDSWYDSARDVLREQGTDLFPLWP